MSLVRGVEREQGIEMKLKEDSLPVSPGSCVVLWTPILPLSPPAKQRGVLCLALPSPGLHLCRENESEEAGWNEAGEKEQSTGSFSVFLCVPAMGEVAYIFLLGSVKITCHTSKGMSLSKGSSSCSLFNHLFTTCGSIVDENKAAFSSNSSPEFCFSQCSDSIIHPAPRTKGFTWQKDILFSIYKHGTTPFADWIKNGQVAVHECHSLFFL